MRLRILPATLVLAVLTLSFKTGVIIQAFAQGAPEAAATVKPPAINNPMAEEPLLPLGLTVEELGILQTLAQRRAALEEREQALSQREAQIEIVDKRIADKLKELDALKREVEGLVRKYDAQEEKEIASMVKIYETMKPKDAARILEQIDFTVLVMLMERIKDRSSAPILSAMNDQVARKLTAELVRRRELKPPG